MVALDPGAAGHYVREKAVQENPARAGDRRAVRGRARQLEVAVAHGPQVHYFLAQFFYYSGSDHALGGGGSYSSAARAGVEARREMATGAAGDEIGRAHV